MARSNRRTFLKHSGLGAAGATIALASSAARTYTANEQVRLGLIGCGGRMGSLSRELTESGGKVVAVCDPDERRLHPMKKRTGAALAATDLRRLLDDKSIDAVTIATPDHWHAPAAILACDAGKHVYVEKPCATTSAKAGCWSRRPGATTRRAARYAKPQSNALIADGRPDAPRRRDRRRAGGQGLGHPAAGQHRPREAQRSAAGRRLRHVGRPGRVGAVSSQPFSLPLALVVQLRLRRLGNDGTRNRHARLGIGSRDAPHPASPGWAASTTSTTTSSSPTRRRSSSSGRRRPGRPQAAAHLRAADLVARITRSTSIPAPSSTAPGEKCSSANAASWRSSTSGTRESKSHAQRAAQAARPRGGSSSTPSRPGGSPNADIEIGHVSTVLVHLGNLAVRLGRSLEFDPEKEQIIGDDEANALLSRKYREGGHWAVPKGV